MRGLPVSSNDDQTICLSGGFRVQKSDSAFLFSFLGELDVWVNRIQVGVKLFYELFMDAGVAIIDAVAKTGHSFDFENVSILNICPLWNRSLFLEAC